MFDRLVEQLREELPDLGINLAVDGKAIHSAGKKSDKNRDGESVTPGKMARPPVHLIRKKPMSLSMIRTAPCSAPQEDLPMNR
jgi:hypothetical protein